MADGDESAFKETSSTVIFILYTQNLSNLMLKNAEIKKDTTNTILL